MGHEATGDDTRSPARTRRGSTPNTDSSAHTRGRFDRILVLELSARAQADPRTARKELLVPDSVGGIVGDRLRREIRALGIR